MDTTMLNNTTNPPASSTPPVCDRQVQNLDSSNEVAKVELTKDALEKEARDRLIENLSELWKEKQLSGVLSAKGFRPPADLNLMAKEADLVETEIEQRLKDTKFELVDKFQSKYTRAHFFKFRQTYKGIPLYGSSSIVELDEETNDIYVDPSHLDRIADIDIKPSHKEITEIKDAQIQLKSWIEKSVGYSLDGLELNPTLYYYYDDEKESWRIVYITDLRLAENQDISEMKPLPELVDYIVDAYKSEGELIAKLSRIKTDPMK